MKKLDENSSFKDVLDAVNDLLIHTHVCSGDRSTEPEVMKLQTQEPERCKHDWSGCFTEDGMIYLECSKCCEEILAPSSNKPLEKPAKKECEGHYTTDGRKINYSCCKKDDLAERLALLAHQGVGDWRVIADEAKLWAVEVVLKYYGISGMGVQDRDNLIERLKDGK